MASVVSRVALLFGVGVAGGAELGKVPIALPLLSQAFGLSLVQGGLLLGMFQIASMLVGIVAGMLADRFGQRRAMVFGLLVAACGSVMGALAQSPTALLVSRCVESIGFMALVLPGPALIARVVQPKRLRAAMGLWACYMPTGMGLVLLIAPLVLAIGGWRTLWWLTALVLVILAALVLRVVEPDAKPAAPIADGATPVQGPGRLVLATLRSPGAWLLAIAFGCYAAQWMSVVGFMPTLYASQGFTPTRAGTLTAIAALVNVFGNFAAGLLLQRSVPAWRLMLVASLTMLVCAWVVFGSGMSFPIRYAALLAFSAVGGLIPGSLFALTHRFAPTPAAISTTTGMMQQGSSLGQFFLPPVVAWVVSVGGGWSMAWVATGALALVNVGLAVVLFRWRRRDDRAARS